MNTDTIWNTYAEDIKRFVFNKTKDKEVTDDLVQEIFIKVHLKQSTLKDTSKLKSWLFTIANNMTLDHFKSYSRKFVTEITQELADEDPTEKGDHNHFDCLQSIVEKLPEKYKTPLFMSDIEGIKQQLIADKLELPLSTIKSQIQRARKKITEAYMDCCGFEMNDKGFLQGEIKDKDDCKVCT